MNTTHASAKPIQTSQGYTTLAGSLDSEEVIASCGVYDIDDVEFSEFYCEGKGKGDIRIDCPETAERFKSECEGEQSCIWYYHARGTFTDDEGVEQDWHDLNYYGGDFHDCVSQCLIALDRKQYDSRGVRVKFTGTFTCGQCGDGELGGNEECDDGGTESGDGCSAACKVEFCGDGIMNNGGYEECDDGNSESGDGCSELCITEFCGDGIVNDGPYEECDDGNVIAEDGCNVCRIEKCGDGIVQKGLDEQCDDGERNSDTEPDACRTDCRNDWCGDGVIDSDEDCDPGIAGTVCNDRCDICRSDSECQGGLCGSCMTFCSRSECYCSDEGSCEQRTVEDSSCTGGECNPWPEQCGGLQPHGLDCGGLPENSCQWCVLDYWGPKGEGYWQCDPYPNAETLFPDACGDGSVPPPPPPPSSSSASNGGGDDGVIGDLPTGGNGDNPDGGGDADDADDGTDEGGSSIGNNETTSEASVAFSSANPTSEEGNSISTVSVSSLQTTTSEAQTSSKLHTGTSSSDEGGDSPDGGGDSPDGGDDSPDGGDDSPDGGDDSPDGGDDSPDGGDDNQSSTLSDQAQASSDNDDSTDDGIDDSPFDPPGDQEQSSSSSFAQCDFCPACISCKRCGLGMLNFCDEQECNNLGICVFMNSILGGSCVADSSICSVCE